MTATIVAASGCRPGVPRGSDLARGELRIQATDEGYIAPDSVSAGLVHVSFENHGSTIHEVMFVKLAPGMDAEAYLAEVRGGSLFPAGALDYSGPGLTSPGGKVEQWLQLDPGRYLLACWFRGHLRATPPRILTVTDSAPGNVPPSGEDVVLRLRDFHFDLQGEPASGPQVIRVELLGPSLHEVDLFRLDEGKTLSDLRAWQKSGKVGPAPAEAVGGVLDSHRIPAVVWLRLSFRPGRYVLWCNMAVVPDAGGGGSATHADVGMFREFVVGG